MEMKELGKEALTSRKQNFPELRKYNLRTKKILNNFEIPRRKFNRLFSDPVESFTIGWGIEYSLDINERNNIISEIKDGNHDQALELALLSFFNPTPLINQFVLHAALLKDAKLIKKMGIDRKQLSNLTMLDLPEEKSDEMNKLIELGFERLILFGIIEVHGKGNNLSFSLNSKYAGLINKYVWPKVDPDGSHRKSLLQ